ncbi:MAG: carbohydrate kinase [Ktedonobacteraceae bacterium]
MKYVLCIGEMLIDFIPTAPIHDLEGSDSCYRPHPGGAPANAAVAVARLGGASRCIGKFSHDTFGQLLIQVLQHNNVDSQYVRSTKEGATALALVSLQDDGQRHFSFYRHRTADTLLDVSDLDWDAWHDVALCHACSITLSAEPSRTATLAAMDHTRQMGALVSFDVNMRPAFWSSEQAMRDAVAEIVPRTDVLKLSVEEAFLFDSTLLFATPEQGDVARLSQLGEQLLQKGPRVVIITFGSKGALLMTKTNRVAVPTVPVRAVDTTGAGDAFIGAILYSLAAQGYSSPADLVRLSQDDLHQIGVFANKVAAISCTRYGGIEALPFLSEVEGL